MSENMDGGVYTEGRIVLVRAKRTETGITLGGPVARCDTAKQAQAIVEAFTENARLTAENARLREALTEMLPRYCEMFSVLALGDPDIDSVAVQIARAALEATDDPR